jgi:mannose-6-phosphate isomerase-like protein (cupin superfamily)
VHEREAMFFVLKGQFELSFEGEDPVTLKAEEGVSLRSASPYTIRNIGAREGRMFSIGMHPQPS